MQDVKFTISSQKLVAIVFFHAGVNFIYTSLFYILNIKL